MGTEWVFSLVSTGTRVWFFPTNTVVEQPTLQMFCRKKADAGVFKTVITFARKMFFSSQLYIKVALDVL